MKTEPVKYQDVAPGDVILSDNHMIKKLNFNQLEMVKEVEHYQSRGAGMLVKITFDSGNQTLGIFDRLLDKVI